MMPSTPLSAAKNTRRLAQLCNVGPAALQDFERLGICTVEQLAQQDPDELYLKLCTITAKRHDPCVHDVLRAAIHQARTGEALDWWAFSPARKDRQKRGTFPTALDSELHQVFGAV